MFKILKTSWWMETFFSSTHSKYIMAYHFSFGALYVKQNTLKWTAHFCSCFHMLQNITLFYRLLVAASVGQNPQGDHLILRHTSLMPNLHGLASIICLIFAPCMELRYRTFSITFYFTWWILLFCSITLLKISFKGQNSCLYLRKVHVCWILQISQVMK